MSLRILTVIAGLGQSLCFAGAAPTQFEGGINLVQPLAPTTTSISAAGNNLPIFVYITTGLGWLHEIAIGLVILWLVFSGMMIMISGNDQGKRTEAKEHMVAAIIGLLMLFLLGFILSVLNRNFFQQ